MNSEVHPFKPGECLTECTGFSGHVGSAQVSDLGSLENFGIETADSISRRSSDQNPAAIPVVSRPLIAWFTRYSRRYICRHFHSLRVSRAGLPSKAHGLPLVIFSNHASWWDALVCLVLKHEFFGERRLFAPMDAAMLERYRFFRRLGFFGVEQHTRRGAIQFLQTAGAILQSRQALLAITPQSRFADVRERPVKFSSGLAHLAKQVERACFIPVAIEYAFWEERFPEILVRFGEPIQVGRMNRFAYDARNWKPLFERALTETQDALAKDSQNRRTDAFEIVQRGGAGQGGIYDLWRWLKARLRGEAFLKEHGTK